MSIICRKRGDKESERAGKKVERKYNNAMHPVTASPPLYATDTSITSPNSISPHSSVSAPPPIFWSESPRGNVIYFYWIVRHLTRFVKPYFEYQRGRFICRPTGSKLVFSLVPRAIKAADRAVEHGSSPPLLNQRPYISPVACPSLEPLK